MTDGWTEQPWAASAATRELEAAREGLLSLVSAWSSGERWRPEEIGGSDLLWLLAEQHGLGGLIGSIGEPECCGPLLKAGRESYFSNLVSHQRCLAVCRQLQRQANAFNIPLSFLEGPVLAEEAYCDAGVRTYSHLDALVSSRGDAWRLIVACGLGSSESEAESGWSRRLNGPGRLRADADGWNVHFRYPLKAPCDPMFDLLERHGNRILRVPCEEGALAAPDPELQLLLLLQHMARRLCCRLLWFVDLVALWRRYRCEIDPEFLAAELDILQCRNVSAAITQFCSSFIDPEFPSLSSGPSGWNTAMQQAMASPCLLPAALPEPPLPLTRYFLITDPKHQEFGEKPAAARWLASRAVHASGLRSESLRRVLEWAFRWAGPLFKMKYESREAK